MNYFIPKAVLQANKILDPIAFIESAEFLHKQLSLYRLFILR